MSNVREGLFPIIRRVRRPLVPTDAGTTASVVVPAKTPEVTLKQETTEPETKTDSAPSEAND